MQYCDKISSSTIVGVPHKRSFPSAAFGKAITSLIDLAFTNIAIKRSRPRENLCNDITSTYLTQSHHAVELQNLGQLKSIPFRKNFPEIIVIICIYIRNLP